MGIVPLNQFVCDVDKVTETVPSSANLPPGWSTVQVTNSLVAKSEYTLCPTHTQKINSVLAGTL